MGCMVRLAWVLAAPLAAAIDLRRSLPSGGRQDPPTRTNVSQPVLLPAGIVPRRYEIHIALDHSEPTYFGEETITVDIVEDGVTELVLHAEKLQIQSAFFMLPLHNDSSASSRFGRSMGPSSIRYEASTATMEFPYPMPRGAGLIRLEFLGAISDEMSGLYRSVYTDVGGKPATLLSTQMEPISARKVFPCWDEPARKAVFKISVTMPSLLQAISNMPVESSVPFVSDSKLVTFAESPVMSTYLLALVVGEFDYVEATTAHGVQMRVYTPKGRSAEGEFALGVATKVLDRFDDYFDIPFPLPKLDLVSIPAFSAGAMENWGLVTFRESRLLIDEGTASAQQKQDVGIVTAHELAHQWFGNLVTMAWWDDLWLNEGFATWMEFHVLAEVHPEYDLWGQFSIGVLEDGMRLDELVRSHPIHVPIGRAEEVSEVFDAITYKKGAAVINMLHSFIGAEAFRKGLQNYLRRHAYSNAKTTDLWDAWSEVTGLEIDAIMRGWTDRPNYPYLTVTLVGHDAKSNEAVLRLEQAPFVDQPGEEGDKLWSIPITAACVGREGTPTTVLMDTKKMQVRVPQNDLAADYALDVNVGRPSPIRVQYGPTMRLSLAAAVASKRLPPTERATLLYDSYRLFRAGKGDMQHLVDLASQYRHEDTYVVWAALREVLLGMDRFMGVANFPVHPLFFGWAYRLIGKGWLATGVGWESPGGSGHVTELLRGVMVELQVKLRGNDPDVAAEARRRYDAYVSSPTAAAAAAALPDTIRTSVFQLVLKKGGQAEYDEIVSLYNRSSSVEQEHILRAIGYARGAELKLAALQWSVSGEVKAQDAYLAFHSVSESSPEGLHIAWTFVKEHITELSRRFPGSLLNKIITSSTSGFCTHLQESEVVAFLGSLALPGSARTMATATERIEKDASVLVPIRNILYGFPAF